ncbi:MAG: ATP-binding protein [Thermodesulfobacteriota bacterium]
MGVGVTSKLLAIVVPLVVLPCLLTGLLGYSASEEIVTRLLTQTQISLAREIATQIDVDFKASRADLKLLSQLPVLNDFYYNRFYGLESEAEISRKQAEIFFQDLARKSSLYYRISYLDRDNLQVACVQRGQIFPHPVRRNDLPFKTDLYRVIPAPPAVSGVLPAGAGEPRVVYLAQPLFDVWNKYSGMVLIELDFDALAQRILTRRVGRQGYAFVVDDAGRILIHPEKRHLGRIPEELNEPSVEVLIKGMLRDRQGMASYQYEGRKIAAFTDVESKGWIVAVALPITEFTEHITIIKNQIFYVVLVAGSLALAVGIFFSWHFLRPIKRLARATNVISQGQLPAQIPYGSRDELGLLTRSFNQMVRNLRRIQAKLVKSEKLVSLGRMAAGVAHEVRNPMNTMNVTLGLLKRKIDRPEVMALAELISEEISRVDHFLSEFLDYARQPPPRPIPTNVNEVIKDILSECSSRLDGKRVVVESRLDPSVPLIPLDPFQIERAFKNVVINGLEAIPGEGYLTVTTKWHPDNVTGNSEGTLELSISDSGVGVKQEDLKSVFDPFFTTKESGTGMGLPITQSIIESHGGRIHIQSKEGEGTAVIIKMPYRLKEEEIEQVDHEAL